jgi:hypothetical protein
MNKFEESSIRFAFGHFLSDYPDDISIDDVLEGIGEKDDIVVWEPFENWSAVEVCKQIHSLAHDFREFADLTVRKL